MQSGVVLWQLWANTPNIFPEPDANFNNYYIGILSHGTDIRTSSNYMKNVKTGIQIQTGEIYLMNTQGMVLRKIPYSNLTLQINTSDLKNGIYFIAFKDKGNRFSNPQRIAIIH